MTASTNTSITSIAALTTASAASASASAVAREWADDFLPRIRRLQHLRPPQPSLPVVFTHIPKCAGSTFRNELLLELVRLHRARQGERFLCVLYRDVFFRERRIGAANASRSHHGPDCLAPDGYFRPRLLVITGHVSYHPGILSRIKPAAFASVVFLREPLSRLVSLFNMYPDGTFGIPPPNATSPAQRFQHAYLRRFEGRNALTCFISGASLCDSVGAIARPTPGQGAAAAASLRRARFNLLHRYDVFGLTERAEESMAMVAWAFGWLPYLARSPNLLQAFRSQRQRRVVPGREHKRVSLDDLCAEAPVLVERMRIAERADRLLYRFARVVYAQRMKHVPTEALALVTGDDTTASSAGGRSAAGGVAVGGDNVTVEGDAAAAAAVERTTRAPRGTCIDEEAAGARGNSSTSNGTELGVAYGTTLANLIVPEEDSAAYP